MRKCARIYVEAEGLCNYILHLVDPGCMLLDMDRKKCRTLSVSGSLMSSTCSPLGSSTVLFSRISLSGFTISASTNNPILLMISCNTKRGIKTIEQGVLWSEHPPQHSASLGRRFVWGADCEECLSASQMDYNAPFIKSYYSAASFHCPPWMSRKGRRSDLSSQAGSGYWSPTRLGGSSASPRGAGGHWGHQKTLKNLACSKLPRWSTSTNSGWCKCMSNFDHLHHVQQDEV